MDSPGRAVSAVGNCLFLLILSFTGCARFHSLPISPEETAQSFESRSLTNADLQAFLAANHVDIHAKTQWDLNMLTLVAFYYQPDLAVARADFAIAQAARVTAGQRPNPSVSLAPEYDTTSPPPWIFGVNWDVPIETAGKRGHRLEQARLLSDAAQWNLVSAAWNARSRVRLSLLDLHAARQTESLLAQQESAQSNVVRLLEGQIRAGAISDFEGTQARIASSTTRLAVEDARRLEAEALARLADALGLPLRALDGVPISFAGFDEFPTRLTAPEVRGEAIVNRADIRGALAEYAASQSALQLEISKQYPDVNIGPGYQLDQTDNKWSLGVTVTLPILNQNQGPIAEAKAKREQAAAHFQSVQAKAIGEMDLALAVYQAALRQMSVANSLSDDLRKRMDSVRAMLQAGELDPLAVANAQIEFNTGAQSRLDAMFKAQQALGQLEDAVQSPLTLPPGAIQAAQTNSTDASDPISK